MPSALGMHTGCVSVHPVPSPASQRPAHACGIAQLSLALALLAGLISGSDAGVGLASVATVAGAATRAGADAAATAARRPFPQHVKYAKSVLVPQVPGATRDSVTLRFWRAWKSRYLRARGSPGLWVQHRPGTNVSEGTGYGMVLSAYFGDRRTFDGLYRHFRAHPSRYSPDLMAWKQKLIDGRMVDVAGRDSATDGDLDIAYALLLAHRQWRSRGPIDYRAQSLLVSRAALAHDVNPRLGNTTPGDWAAGKDTRRTRTSDFMPAHFDAFARVDPDSAWQWRRVKRSTSAIALAQFRNGSRRTGLLPDFMAYWRGEWRPVRGVYLESKHDGDFGYNACRDPWRLSLPYLLMGQRRLRPLLLKHTVWLRTETNGDPAQIRAGYYVRNGPNGQPYRNYPDLAFTAPAAVNAMLGGDGGQRWLNRLWRAITRGPSTSNYYSDSLRLMALLILSRNWWQP